VLVAGVVIAGLAYLRGYGLGLLAVLPLIWWLQGRRVGELVRPTLIMGLVAALLVALWIVRNHSHFGQPTFGTNLGVNLYLGNHAGLGWVVDYTAHPALPPTDTRRNEAELSALLMAEALRFVREQPLAAIANLPKKLGQLYLLETGVVSLLFQGEHPGPSWLKFALYGACQGLYLLLMALLLVRLADYWDRRRRPEGLRWAGWVVVLYFTLVTLVFFGSDRFRLPIMPWLIIEVAVLLAGRVARIESTYPPIDKG